MTVARAPGKLVLSGAYSVLWGAPAIVTAVSRGAVADTARAPVHIADEVRAAVSLGFVPAPCWVDASELRTDGGKRKIGLGSSAAILVATMLAYRDEPRDAAGRRALFDDGLRAHRAAQGGGSGIDVAASAFGGTLKMTVGNKTELEPIALPKDLFVAVFAARHSAVTAGFVAAVRAFADAMPDLFRPILERASAGARQVAGAESARAWVEGVRQQGLALRDLGDQAGVPIVTADVVELAALALDEDGCFVPSGAGGGDVAFYAADHPPSASLIEAAVGVGYDALVCSVDADGARVVKP